MQEQIDKKKKAHCNIQFDALCDTFVYCQFVYDKIFPNNAKPKVNS